MTEPGIAAGGAETSAENLGLLVGMLRLLRGWSQQDLAQAAAMHQTTVSKYEMGSPPPGWTELVRLAAAVGMPMWAVDGVLLPAVAVSRRLAALQAQSEMPANAVPHGAASLFASDGRALNAAARVGIAEILVDGLAAAGAASPAFAVSAAAARHESESAAAFFDAGVLVGFLRLLAKRTQKDMAAAAAIHVATLSRYEQGRQVPGPATIARLASVARLPLWFLDGVLVPVIDFARLLLH